jgi:hypothetical protein
MKLCVRCEQPSHRTGARWPEGIICRRCFQQATRKHGTCPGCQSTRLLPGLLNGQPACTDCAGIPHDFHCPRCGREDEPARDKLCSHCVLRDELTQLLDDGNGQVAKPLIPLFEALTTQQNARSARTWLAMNNSSATLLSQIAKGAKPLTHEAFTGHPQPGKVSFLRELCVEHGLLNGYHKDIEAYETWLETKLSTLTARNSSLIRRYGKWAHLNRMHHLADTGKLRKGTLLSARQSTTAAIGFLDFLTSRETDPGQCRQQDIDDWLISGPTTHALARTFVRWAIKHHHMPKLEFPYRTAQTARIISQEKRLDLIHKAVGDGSTRLSPADQAAAILLLVYGQPLARIARLRRHQLKSSSDLMTLTVDTEELTIPAPFDAVFSTHLATLPHQNTSAHARETWLFPGQRPGEHVHQNTLMNRLRRNGIDLLGAKNAAIRSLVLEIPAPLVAEAFNYSYQVTEKHRRASGAAFMDYITVRS